jgi:hypothetical protein
MHFLFNLLTIKGLYMFQELFADPQEALLVYCMRAMSVGYISTPILVQPTDSRNIPNAACVAPPEDEQVMLETCRGP